MKIGLIISKKLKTDDFFLEEAKKIGEVKQIPISNVSLLIDDGINFVYEYEDITKFDLILFRVPKTKYNLAAPIIESLSKKVITLNSPKAFYSSASRLSLYQALSRDGIKVPRIVFADDPETAIFNLKLLRFPILIKVPTDKKKVMLANSQQEAKSMIDALQVLEQPMLLEEYYPEAKLIQVFLLGKEVIVALEKRPEDINYTGGELKIVKPGKKIIKVALETITTLKTDYARIDILDTAEPIVVDVNLCPLLSDVTKLSNMEIVPKILKYAKMKFESNENKPKIEGEVKSMLNGSLKPQKKSR